MASDACIILTSVAAAEDAERIAEQLVALQLAACVQISAAGQSLYRWQGRIERQNEYYLSIKTTADKAGEARDWIEANHPYETPEILCLQADAAPAYLQWMRATTG